MNKQMLLLITGPRSSGKTTLANNIINKHPDFMRISIDNLANMNITSYSSKEKIEFGRNVGYELALLVLVHFLDKGVSVVIDDHFEKEEMLTNFISCAAERNIKSLFLILEVNKQSIVEREESRPHKVDTTNVKSEIPSYIYNSKIEQFVIDTNLITSEKIYLTAKEHIDAKLRGTTTK